MIRKYLLGLLVGLFCFLGFSYGYNLYDDMYVRQNGNYGFSPYNNTFDIQVINRGNLLTNQIGLTLRGIYLRDGSYMVWRYSDYLGGVFPYLAYTVSGSSSLHYEGYPTHYALCDEFDGENHIQDYDLSGCTVYELNGGSIQLISNFMSSVTLNDTFGFSYKYADLSTSTDNAGILFCFSSSFYNKSICFGISHYTYGYIGVYPGFNVTSSMKNAFTGYGQVNLPTSFTDLANSNISLSPGQVLSGGNIVGSTEGVINNELTGDYVYVDCSYNDVVITLESEGYNEYLCYGGLDNFDLYDSSVNYSPIPGSGLTLNQIWGWQGSRAWDNFNQWYSFWHGLYYDDNNNYNAMWESYPAVYRTYFQLLGTYGDGIGIHPLTLLEYCNIKTFSGFDLNASASSSTFSEVCGTVIREKQTGLWDCRTNGTLYSGCELNPQNPVGVNWNGVGNIEGSGVKSDGTIFIQDYFNLVKTNFFTNYTGGLLGIIPNYIVLFMLALILFRLISH